MKAARAYLSNKDETPRSTWAFSASIWRSRPTRRSPGSRDAAKRRSTRSARARSAELQQPRTAAAEGRRRSAGGAARTADGAARRRPAAWRQQGDGRRAGRAQLAQMEADMIAGFEPLERDQQGYATVNGLFAIIGAMRRLPGRKSLVLFSEGVAIPPAVHRLFLGVIDAANRANVSIYTMDAAGLRAESEQAKIRDQVNAAGKRGLTSYASAPPDLARRRAADEGARAQRRRASPGPPHGSRRACPGHRRPDLRQHQQPANRASTAWKAICATTT